MRFVLLPHINPGHATEFDWLVPRSHPYDQGRQFIWLPRLYNDVADVEL